ncbi:MAG: PAS domain-containing protein [Desulfobulbaceae bacterium]|nr:PAS domain-containing protein [Desulfobulbaceae bacterium]
MAIQYKMNLQTLRHLIRWFHQTFILAGSRPGDDLETVRRISLMNLISLFGIVFLLPMGMLAFRQGNLLLWAVDYIAVVFLTTLMVWLRKNGDFTNSSRVGVTGMGFLFFYLFLSGGISGSAFLWLYVFPLFSLYLLGCKEGLIGNILFIFPVTFHAVINVLPEIFITYPPELMQRFLPSYLAVFLYAYMFENTRDQMNRQLSKKQQELILNIAALEDAQRDLRKSHGVLESTYTELKQLFNIAVPLCVLSQNFRIDRVNRAFCEYFGVDDFEVINRRYADFLKTMHPTPERLLTDLQQGGATEQVLISHLHPDGSRRFSSVHAVSYSKTIDDFQGMIITFFDITDTCIAEEKLQQAQKQLVHAEKLGAIGRLSASIAHEINNPLTGIKNVISRIKRKGILHGAEAELVTMAAQECDRIKKLILDLRDFHRPSSEKPKTCNIHDLLDQILLLSRKELEKKKIYIIKEYCTESLELSAVEDQLKQVFLNLLNNASDAMPETGGDITIQTARAGDRAVIKVHDTGKGISDKDREQIFEPFFTTKSAVKGTGLGLSVSYGIIKSHGGDIALKSEPDKGSTFTVTLPGLDPEHQPD